jgi:hypothetical protein
LRIGFVSPKPYLPRLTGAAFCPYSLKYTIFNNDLRQKALPDADHSVGALPFHGKNLSPAGALLVAASVEKSRDGPRPIQRSTLMEEEDNPDHSLDAHEDSALAINAAPTAAETWPSESSSHVSVRVACDPAEPPAPSVDPSALQPPPVSASCGNANAVASAVARLFRPTRFACGGDDPIINALFDRIGADLSPRDLVGQMLAEQYAMLLWEASRLRLPYLQLCAEVGQLASQPHEWPMFAKRLAQLGQINQLIANNEARQIALLREIERHRVTLAQRLRSAVEQVEDAEFQELDH